jgi:phosphate transport system substrate-binding protein
VTSSRWIAVIASSSVLALGVAACGSSGNESTGGGDLGTINGSGSTFAQPIVSQWGSDLKSKGLTVNYQGIGSGGGISQFQANTVDFADTDAAMDDSEIKVAEKYGAPVHVPIVFGAVTVSYNLPGVESGLKLDGETIAGIYLGKIAKWDDPAIAKLNPGVKLPATGITVVHRSDESGTTALFTQFLDEYSKEWHSQVGADKTVKWPTGTGANGNDGVAGAVSQTEGAIGYVELAYALQNEFTTAAVQNSSGSFITPDLKSTSAAGDGLKVPADLRFSAINSPGSDAYPIASATFVLVYRDMCEAGKSDKTATGVGDFLDYALGAGQKTAEKLDYAPLPPGLLEKARAKVESLTCNGAPLEPSAGF